MTARFKTLLSCCVVVACLAASCAAVSAAEVQLRAEVHTQKSVLTLGDIAHIFSADSQEIASLAAIELMPAPVPGARLAIRMREVQDILSADGVNLANVEFAGSAQVVVIGGADMAKFNSHRPGRQQLQQARRVAADAITEYLRTAAGAEQGLNVSVDLEENQIAPIVAAGGEIKVSGGTQPWSGRQTFEFELPTADGSARLRIAADIALPPQVVVTVRTVSKGEIVRASDVELERLQPGVATANFLQSIDDVVGKEAAKNLAAGQPLDGNLVHSPLMVHTGEVVTVFGRNAGIVVRMPARARENGSEGDLVTVESLLDRQTFLARVCGLHEVEVFAGATTTAPSESNPRQAFERAAMN